MQSPTGDQLPASVLVICAHPDDVDFGSGGTIATWTSQGVQVSYAIVTDGDAGGFDPAIDRRDIPSIRRAEQREAAEILGVKDVEFLGYRDGQVVADLALRADLSQQIRRVRPERVLCPSPERDFARLPASHPDHLAVGEASIAAIYPDARNPFAFPELLTSGLDPFTVHDVWLMGHPVQDRFVDITETFDKKTRALRAHVSQLPKPDETVAFVASFGEAIAARAGFPAGRRAESFFAVTVP